MLVLPILLLLLGAPRVSSRGGCSASEGGHCNASVVALPYPCFPESWCAPGDNGNASEDGQWYTGNAGCNNWVCSLRVNCGCFAGETGLPAKPGCQDIVDMFFEHECSWADYLPCLHDLAYVEALADCGLSAAPSLLGSGPALLPALASLAAAAAVGRGR